MKTDHSDNEIDAELAGWLKAHAPTKAIRAIDEASLLHRIDINGLGPLLALTNHAGRVSHTLSGALRLRLLSREYWEAQHRRILTRALQALDAEGLQPLIMKGTALAYSHYERPSFRVRGDSDIFIVENGKRDAIRALTAVGFTRPVPSSGEVRVSEETFQMADPTGVDHFIDLHWRMNNFPIISELFPHRELFERSVSVPSLDKSARRAGDLDALLIACVHRQIHLKSRVNPYFYVNDVPYLTPDSLTWVIDIHYLFCGLSDLERAGLVRLASAKGLGPIVHGAIMTCKDRLGTSVPDGSLTELSATEPDQITKFLKASYARQLLGSFRTTRGRWARAKYIQELLFPSSEYMRARFGRGQFDLMPVLHVRRGLHALSKHFGQAPEKV